MRSPAAIPDPRVLAIVHHALDEGVYSPATQIALVRCFTAVFSDTGWWQDMLRSDSDIAQLVEIANLRVLH